MTFTHNTHIAVPLARVFEFVDDDTLVKRWVKGLEATFYPRSFDRSRPLGTPVILRVREGSHLKDYTGRITSYDPPRHFGMQYGDKSFDMHIEYTLNETDQGTEVLYTARLDFKVWLSRLMSRLFAGFTRRGMLEHIERLKTLAESEAGLSNQSA